MIDTNTLMLAMIAKNTQKPQEPMDPLIATIFLVVFIGLLFFFKFGL